VVNLRTAKIQLLMLLNDRTPIERFDVTGPFDFSDELRPLEEFRNIALEARPDLKVAVQNVDLAKITTSWPFPTARPIRRSACGGRTILRSTIPYDYNTSAPASAFRCASSTGIRARRRARRSISAATSDLRDAAEAQVFNDVDSAYWTLVSVNLLKPYKSKYLKLAADTATSVVFLIRTAARLCWITWMRRKLIGTPAGLPESDWFLLTAAAQMNMAVGREVVQ
jgi:outer membrane protein, heavy metal efflux system